MNRIIGLIVNSVAGMGGSVGLKGTDGEMYKKAVELGAKPVTPKRTDEVLSHIKKKAIKLNMNEVPYLPPKEIIEAAKKGLKNLNRYSDPENIGLNC